MSEHFWRYHRDSGLVDSALSEEIAVFYADDPTVIVFSANLYPEEEYPRPSGDIFILGPECFIDAKGRVIAYQGENYYKACGTMVRYLPEGGTSHCVKRVNHPSNQHEDYKGHTRYA